MFLDGEKGIQTVLHRDERGKGTVDAVGSRGVAGGERAPERDEAPDEVRAGHGADDAAAEGIDERDAAVKILLGMAISACNRLGRYIGICGQGPSDHPELAAWLLQQGIQSMSLNPDVIADTWMMLSRMGPPPAR